MECPRCQSQDVYLCSVAYAQGTTTTHTTSRGSGRVGAYVPKAGFVSGSQTNVQHSSATTHSAFAMAASPPRPGRLVAAIIFVILATLGSPIIWGLLGGMAEGLGYPIPIGILILVALAVMALSIWTLVAALKYRPKYRAAYERWLKTWICGHCGSKFVPNE